MIAWVPDGEEEDSVAEQLLVFDSRYNVMLEYDLITVSLWGLNHCLLTVLLSMTGATRMLVLRGGLWRQWLSTHHLITATLRGLNCIWLSALLSSISAVRMCSVLWLVIIMTLHGLWPCCRLSGVGNATSRGGASPVRRNLLINNMMYVIDPFVPKYHGAYIKNTKTTLKAVRLMKSRKARAFNATKLNEIQALQ